MNVETYQHLLFETAALRAKLVVADIDREARLEGLKDLSNLDLKLVAAMTTSPAPKENNKYGR